VKRVLALSLLLVMVLSAGALAADPEKPVNGYYDIGSLQDEDDNIGFEFPFTVTIEKYARVWLVENKLFKNPLMGAAGLYTSDEWQVIRDAQAYFAASWAKHTGLEQKSIGLEKETKTAKPRSLTGTAVPCSGWRATATPSSRWHLIGARIH